MFPLPLGIEVLLVEGSGKAYHEERDLPQASCGLAQQTVQATQASSLVLGFFTQLSVAFPGAALDSVVEECFW